MINLREIFHLCIIHIIRRITGNILLHFKHIKFLNFPSLFEFLVGESYSLTKIMLNSTEKLGIITILIS